MRNFLRYEIFAEQEANRIFAIIFSWITGSSWKGSMLQISNCCKLGNFHGLNFRCTVGDREIREIYLLTAQLLLCNINLFPNLKVCNMMLINEKFDYILP